MKRSLSLITNLDGEIVQKVEHMPFSEVFLEERNNKWNITPPASTVINILTITPDFVRTKIGEVRSAVIRGNRIYGLAPIYGRLP